MGDVIKINFKKRKVREPKPSQVRREFCEEQVRRSQGGDWIKLGDTATVQKFAR